MIKKAIGTAMLALPFVILFFATAGLFGFLVTVFIFGITTLIVVWIGIAIRLRE